MALQAVIEGAPLKRGDTLKDFNGRSWRFLAVTDSAIDRGKIVVNELDGPADQNAREFFPSVFPRLRLREQS